MARKLRVQVVADLEALSRAAAEEFARRARAAIARNGRFSLALAGGTTPARLYRLLADPRRPWRRRVQWEKVHVFFSDERAVPPGHPESNYGMARAALLRRVPIPAAQVHRIDIRGSAVRRAATAYAQEIRRAFALRPGDLPRFDLVLLGVGGDGHIASLFPGSPALRAIRPIAVGIPRGSRGLPRGLRPRVSFTLPVIGAAGCVLILAAGSSKTAAVAAALGGRSPAARPVPAGLVGLRLGDLVWIVDRDAAEALPGRRRR